MKKKILSIGFLLTSMIAISQDADSVALGAGYANESYYSFINGEVSNVNNGNWDLAFDLSAYGATVRFNRRISTLYLYAGDTTTWSSLDTTGLATWDQYIDGYQDWSQGALNGPADSGNAADLGWGIYNTVNHHTEGNRIFVVKLQDASYRKLWVKLLAGGIYTFRFANLDNSNDITETINKADYSGKNFIHYSLLNETVVDREPASASWDIVFTNYVLELAPDYYSGVTGALSNINVEVEEVTGVPSASAAYTGAFDVETDVLGYDWKSYNFGLMQYDMVDSLTYFVLTNNGDIWKLVFTGFNGSSDGKIFFEKQLMTSASVVEKEIPSMTIYPNPANNEVYLLSGAGVNAVSIYDLNGRLMFTQKAISENITSINLSDVPEGIYLLVAKDVGGNCIQKKLVVSH